MEPEFNEKELRRKLKGLQLWKQVAFLISICERLYPNFVIFSRETGHKGEEVLRSSLNTAWDELGGLETGVDFALLYKNCYAVAPDTEDYQTIFVSSALDAASSVCLLMEFLMDSDTDHVTEAASLARDTVDMYAQEDLEDMYPPDPEQARRIVTNPSLYAEVRRKREESILSHPLMQTELTRQKEDIELLKSLGDDVRDSINMLRERWFDTRASSIGLKI